MIVPVILSGGSGTRLWPLSRPKQPKQLLAMVDERTMLRATFDRLAGLPDMVDPWVVCNADHHLLVGRELFAAGYKPGNVILEPVGRNTAPAAAAAALVIGERDPDALMLLLPADHVIQDEDAFRAAVSIAAPHSAAGSLATFGIVPTYPETGYGYIKVGDPIELPVCNVARFVEKPDERTAQHYVDSGDFLWNSGMFLFSVSRYLEELDRLVPEMMAATREAVAEADRANGIALNPAAFAKSPSDSIDFAVMEHTDSAVVIPLDAGWSDVGSWAALWELVSVDDGNVFVGDVTAVDVTGSYLRAESRLLAAIGIDGLVVVETPDAVMVAPRNRSQDVKAMVDLLRQRDRREVVSHAAVPQQWGTIETVLTTDSFRLRRLTFTPDGSAATLQGIDADRVWVVASGAGNIEVAGVLVDMEGSGVRLPAGSPVVVTAAGNAPMEIVEIQHFA